MIMATIYVFIRLPVFYCDTLVGIRNKMKTNINALTLDVGINTDYTSAVAIKYLCACM